MASTVVQAGDYLLELDTGWDSNSFRLNDTEKGVLGNTTYTLGPNTQYADITEYATTITYNRGRRKSDYQFGAGTMTFVMRDETGILGPYDTTSPYYDPANNKPGLAPMRAVRLSRQGEYLFTGVVTGYTYDFNLAGPNTVVVECADEFYKLAQTQLDQLNVSVETSGARINTVLALPEVDYTGATSIATGTVNLGSGSSYTVPQGTNTLAYLQQINQAEQGRLFVARDGTITFQERIGMTSGTPLFTFSDGVSGAKYDGVEIEFDADNVVNRVYVEGLDGKNATVDDTTSIGTYFIQNKTIQNLLLDQQSEINALATYLLEPEPEPRYTSVSTWLGLLTSTQRDDITTLDIGDTITIDKTIPGLGTTVNSDLAIEGIQGTIDVNRGHRITFYTSPTVIVFELILDDAVYGRLDFNVLG
jgi:hypothetical protein